MGRPQPTRQGRDSERREGPFLHEPALPDGPLDCVVLAIESGVQFCMTESCLEHDLSCECEQSPGRVRDDYCDVSGSPLFIEPRGTRS